MTDEQRWAAVMGRDRSVDSQFYYGVVTTGIYCRPSCPSRRPRRENVVFFDSPEAAEAAGFRPCLRCRPDEVGQHQIMISRVKRLIEDAFARPKLADLAASVGYSPYHLQRLFKRYTGVSPAQFYRDACAERLRSGLRQCDGVAQVTYDAGYGSSRAAYMDSDRRFGMSPGRYRSGGAGLTIDYALFDTELGRVLLAATEKGVCALWFGEGGDLVRELQLEYPHATLKLDELALDGHVLAVKKYLSSYRATVDVPLDIRAREFQRRVWDAISQIPAGETRTYAQLAAAIGEPKAVRAVARACASNPVALVIPCHRVIGSDGRLHGYRWGLPRKRALLEHEACAARGDQEPGGQR